MGIDNAPATTNIKVVAVILGALVLFSAGAFVGIRYFAPALTQRTETKIVEKPTIVQGETKIITDTQIAYVPKETIIYKYINSEGQEIKAAVPEKTDIDANIGKAEVYVRLNGQDVAFNKADDEQFVFEKNKISLAQSSTIAFEAIVTPVVIDKTKRWGIGIGYGSNGVAGKVDFPVGRYGGWVYVDRESKAGGLEVRF